MKGAPLFLTLLKCAVKAALHDAVEQWDEAEEQPGLPMSSAARVITADAGAECPPPGDESALLRWVRRQRERQVAWADIAQLTASAGHDVGEDALRMRYRRWRERTGQPSGDPPPAAQSININQPPHPRSAGPWRQARPCRPPAVAG
jgi:hypothetical protein